MSELTHCSICGCALEDEAECYEVENEILCQECYDNETVVCDHCGERCIERNTVSDENTILCTDCYDNHYYRCSNCETIVHSDDTYWRGDNAIAVNVMTIAVITATTSTIITTSLSPCSTNCRKKTTCVLRC